MGSEDNYELFPYVAAQLNKYGLAYLHIMDGHGFGFHGKSKSVTTYDMRKGFDGPIIANVGLTKDTAEGMIRSGVVDLAAFGRPYISNPDKSTNMCGGGSPCPLVKHFVHNGVGPFEYNCSNQPASMNEVWSGQLAPRASRFTPRSSGHWHGQAAIL